MLTDLKEVCNKIVGHWYCKEIKQEFIFYLNDWLLKQSKLVVINSETFETKYGVAVRLNPDPTDLKTLFYFDIGIWDTKRYYDILSLTKDMLVIQEFYMDDRPPRSPHIYRRRTDITVADEILKGIDLDE